MIELQGKYGIAKVFTDNVEETAVGQIINLLNQPFVEGCNVRIMPDTHAGAGCVIGFTANMGKMVIPNLVGVDIGCGMYCVNIGFPSDVNLENLDAVIHEFVPAGFDVHANAISSMDLSGITCLEDLLHIDRFQKALGTLGGGNHFIELNKGKRGYYLVVHSGSRNLGKQVAEYHQKIADLMCPEITKGLAYLNGQWYDDYLHDMRICQMYASRNRMLIADEIMSQMGWVSYGSMETVHNYIDHESGIIRKGAVSAQKGEPLIIPINMRDGSLLCVGKGNPDWNYSAPHGAGRLMGRGAAKRTLKMEDFTDSMKDVYSSTVGLSTLDEAPMAYKPMQEIIDNIQDTVEIVDIIKPVYNFKSAGD